MRLTQVAVRWKQGLCALGALLLLLCWARPAVADFIYWSDTGLLSPGRSVTHIKRANLDGTGVQTILTATGTGFGGIAFDAAHGYLYSGDNQFIFRTNLDGTGRVNLTPIGGAGATGDVELDLLHGRIYWNVTDAAPTLIRSANLDGSNATTLVSKPSGLLEGIALNPAAGKMYYTFTDGTIDVANLDGTSPGVFKSGLSSLHDVEIDAAGGKLYWNQDTTGPQGLLRRTNLDGTGGIQDLLASGTNRFPDGINFDPVDQKLYYYLANVSGPVITPLGLGRVNADGTGNQIVLNDLDGINYIEVLHLPQEAAAVPEPGTLALAGAGLLSLLGYRWGRKPTV